MKGNLEMNAGQFEQISDCWSSEQQPAAYYSATAARARRLQAYATTPRVKQYLHTMIPHCEGLAGPNPAPSPLDPLPLPPPNPFTLSPRRPNPCPSLLA